MVHLVIPKANLRTKRLVPSTATAEKWLGSLCIAHASEERSYEMEFVGYCVKCRKQQQIKQGTVQKTSKGRPMAKGPCPTCGTTVTRFLSDKESK